MHFLKTMITILSLFIVSTTQWLPKIVWTFWNKPLEKENDLLKALHKSHSDRLAESGWQLRHLNDENLWQWADKIPKLKQAYEHPFWKELAAAPKADFIRIAILSYYGGVYMDMSIILTRNMDWILGLRKLPHIENVYGEQPNIFYYYARHSNKEKYYDVQTKQKFIIQPAVELFFLACKPNNAFMIEWLNFAVEQKMSSYEKYKRLDKASVFVDIAKQENIDIGWFTEKYFQMSVAALILLVRKQRQLDKVWNYDPFKPRKIAVKELKIWTVNSNFNAYIYLYFNQGFVKPLISVPAQKFKKQDQGRLTPFVKFWHETYEKILKFLSSKQQRNCHNELFLLDSSILYQYVLKTYPIKFYTASVYDDQTYRKECTFQGQSEKYQIQLQEIHPKIIQLDKPEQEISLKKISLNEQNDLLNKQIVAIHKQTKQLDVEINSLSYENEKIKKIFKQQESRSSGNNKLPLVSKLKLKIGQLSINQKENLQKKLKIQAFIHQLQNQVIVKNNQFEKLKNQFSQSLNILSEIKDYQSKFHKFVSFIILLLIFLLTIIVFLLVQLYLLRNKKNNVIRYRQSIGEKTALSQDKKEADENE